MDRISELPDCVLSYILSMLSMKDLMKTSILSKRWWKLWSLSRDLNFDISNMFNEKEIQITKSLLVDKFVQRVGQFIKNFQGTKIDSFRVCFYLKCEHSCFIDQWISFAIARGVGRIELRVRGPSGYKFPFNFFSKSNASSLKHIHLQNVIFSPPANLDAALFSNLRSVVLREVWVGENIFIILLSKCLLLEELSLIACPFPPILMIVSSSLRHLKIQHNNEVNVVSLECFKQLEYQGQFSKVCCINAPVLKSICLNVARNFQIPNALASFADHPQLEILTMTINFNSYLVENSLRRIRPLKNLKQLNLFTSALWDDEFDNLWIFTILRACPFLQKLSFTAMAPKFLANQKESKDLGIFSHSELKTIELYGCVGNWYEIEFAMIVLKYVSTLEKIVLSPFWKHHEFPNWSSASRWFQSGRERVRRKLQDCEVAGQAQLILI